MRSIRISNFRSCTFSLRPMSAQGRLTRWQPQAHRHLTHNPQQCHASSIPSSCYAFPGQWTADQSCLLGLRSAVRLLPRLNRDQCPSFPLLVMSRAFLPHIQVVAFMSSCLVSTLKMLASAHHPPLPHDPPHSLPSLHHHSPFPSQSQIETIAPRLMRTHCQSARISLSSSRRFRLRLSGSGLPQ